MAKVNGNSGSDDVRLSRLRTLRNIGIAAHVDAGKTTTTERILYYSGVEHRLGDVDDGTATMDWMDQEKERGITITAAATTCRWKDHQINVIDTPGHVDFTAEVERSLRVLDGMVAVFCSVGGVEAQSETVCHQAARYHVPWIAFINKMDRVGADFNAVVDELRNKLWVTPVVMNYPLFRGDGFVGVLDVVTSKALVWDEDTLGVKWVEEAVPEEHAEELELRRQDLIETVAEYVDWFMELVLEGKNPDADEIRRAVREATISARITPVLCGASLRNKGIQPLIDAVVNFLPSPADLPDALVERVKTGEEISRRHRPDEPLGALAFKVASDRHGDLIFVRVYSGVLESGSKVYNASKGKRERVAGLWRMHADDREGVSELSCGDIGVVSGLRFTSTGDTLCSESAPVLFEKMKFPETVVSMAIEAKTNAGREKLDDVLRTLEKEDPTFEVTTDGETGQTIISGMGELHLEVLRTRMVRDFSVEVNVGNPRVAYRETLAGPVKIDEEMVRQAGGRGQYARVVLEMEPIEGTGVEFEERTGGEQVPKEFMPGVVDGVQSSAQSGGLKGYPVIGVKATLVDGGFHPVDSSEVAFAMASSRAFQRGLEKAGTVMLEPVMRVEVFVPEEYLGDVLNDFNGRRAEVEEVVTRGRVRLIRGRAPLAKMFGYATGLRSLTQGRAVYTMEPLEYGRAPAEGGR